MSDTISPLLSLPPELLLSVADKLPLSALSALTQTCKPLHNILTPVLYTLASSTPAALRSTLVSCTCCTPSASFEEWSAHALHIAAHKNFTSLAKQLLDSDPEDVDVCDELGFTPLFYAAKEGHLDMVKMLVEGGADPNGPLGMLTSVLMRPVWIAAKWGHMEVVGYLNERGCVALSGMKDFDYFRGQADMREVNIEEKLGDDEDGKEEEKEKEKEKEKWKTWRFVE